MPNLRITTLEEAQRLLLHDWPAKTVSLIDRNVGNFGSHGPDHLVLRMDEYGKTGLPSMRDLQRTLAFTADLGVNDRLLVHCMMGVSRSPAMAIAILIGLGHHWRLAFERVEALRPMMFPNRDITAMTDRHFGLKGALLRYHYNWSVDQHTSLPARISRIGDEKTLDNDSEAPL